MKRTLLDSGWQFRPKVNPFAEMGGAVEPYVDVVVPHDAVIGSGRDPNGDAAVGYFPGGTFQYRTNLSGPSEPEQCVLLEFEGVYRDAVVFANGHQAGQQPYGYSTFIADVGPHLRPDLPNEILVEARAHKDSRWYTGAGIYREAWLCTSGPVHVPPHGLRVWTPDIDAVGAVAEVAVTVQNRSARSRTVAVEVRLSTPDDTEVAAGVSVVTVEPASAAITRQRLYVHDPRVWSAEDPFMYTASVQLKDDGDTIDETDATFGVRRLQLDPVNGLRVNGETVKLRGACIHHDNGILGAATFPAAEERRARLLKAAGFNAVRSAHNPISRAMLDACDRVGLYVLDETFDVWVSGKSEFDYALHFTEWWERDVTAMIEKDFNHPSVLMYSIGNEIPEAGSPAGGLLGRRLAEKVRELDPTRFVTNAVNGLLAVMSDLKAAPEDAAATSERPGINSLMAGAGEAMNAIGSSALVTDKTAESFALLDVAGMNYLDARYAMDRELFPNRVILGTETFPPHIANNWALVKQYSHVIGDFTWTGWDYLGEVGIGRRRLGDGEPSGSLTAPYPWIAAWCGDIDIVGHRRPASYYREIVFGLRNTPYLSVVRPGRHGAMTSSPWAWSESISSWTWPGAEGLTVEVEVYSDADEVELTLNGRSLERRPSGPASHFRTVFAVEYEVGELSATAFRSGQIVGHDTLRTAQGPIAMHLSVDQDGLSTRGPGLAFVQIELVDEAGTVFTGCDRLVTVELDGPAVLQALGTGNPVTEEDYLSASHTTFDGRALAVVRALGTGDITVRVCAEDCAPAVIVIDNARH